MRLIPLVCVSLLVGMSTPAGAQEFIDFISREDGFSVNVPGQPTVAEIKWESEYGSGFPGRLCPE